MAETVESNSKQYIYDNTVIHVDRKFENDTPICDILKQYIWETTKKYFAIPKKCAIIHPVIWLLWTLQRRYKFEDTTKQYSLQGGTLSSVVQR